ncbi:MAG TPA: kinase, partial [Thermoplasmataceae archaeon]|nr:kinase [Thermoplasmataceae archaeon]
MVGIKPVVSYSPLRISFGGGGTDISPFPETHGGAVINTTIDRGVTVTYKEDRYPLEISSRDFVSSYILSSGRKPGNVLEKLMDLFDTNEIRTGRVIINSDVPPGSGLGSSSALTTAVLKLIYELRGKDRSEMEIASEAFETEKNKFGVTLGKQDPYAISLGGFKFMKFRKDGVDNYSIRNQDSFVRNLESRILLVYTGETRESSDVLMEQVQKASRNDQDVLSNLVVLRDLAENMRKSVINEDMDKFIEDINEGWDIKKKLGTNVTNNKIDRIIRNALDNGAQGAKLMGGGSQGFLLIVSKEEMISELQKKMLQW